MLKAVKVVAIVACLSSMTPWHGVAEEVDNTGGLLEMCKAPSGSSKQIYCIGYIRGVAEVMMSLDMRSVPTLGEETKVTFSKVAICGRIQVGAGVQAFKNWAEKHPEKWSTSQTYGVMTALHELWPC
jgi:hypothetical protein